MNTKSAVAHSAGLSLLRKGFHPSFWIANGMELFERLAYYGQATILTIFLRDTLALTPVETGMIASIFGGLIYFLPIFAGAIADKIGFRKAFSIAFLVLAVGYFLIGSTGMGLFAGLYAGVPKFWLLVPFVCLTAMGGSFIKPSVLGTVAVASTPETKSLGFAVYYWLVNAGAFLGPNIAHAVRSEYGYPYVYVVSAVSCLIMFAVTLLFYRDVRPPAEQGGETLGARMKSLVVVLGNTRFMLFLLIFSLYWIMFWAGFYIVVPNFARDFISPKANYEASVSVGALAIFALQLIVNRGTRKLSPSTAVLIGFGVSSMSWLVVLAIPSLTGVALAMCLWSIGEMIQAPRYYELISDLAPKGQQALFQGYAFLPIAIAWAIGGTFGGWLYASYGMGRGNASPAWLILFCIGVAGTVLMWIYNVVVARLAPRTSAAS